MVEIFGIGQLKCKLFSKVRCSGATGWQLFPFLRAEILRRDRFWHLLERDLKGFTCAERTEQGFSAQFGGDPRARQNMEY